MEVKHRIQAGYRVSWKTVSRVFKLGVRPLMLYGGETWPMYRETLIKKLDKRDAQAEEDDGTKTSRDRVQSDTIRKLADVVEISR